jgi:hypothetical protein
MLVEAHKDYTANLGNRNFSKGGFSLTDDVPLHKVESTKNELIKIIDRWIEEAIEQDRKRFANSFKGFD